MKTFVIIVAGGSGSRMYSEIPKQFLNVNGIPLLFHTIKCFDNYNKDIHIILVLPEPYVEYWKSIVKKNEFHCHHQLTIGGQNRFYSVRNGLRLIPGPGLIAVHDGVRPLVSKETLQRVFMKAEKEGNAVPAISLTESIRKMETIFSKPVNRNHFRLIQTPQCFHSELIIKAYEQDYREEFTDDASVLEASGIKINLVEGNPENIKITRPSDLKYAEALLK